MLSEVGFNHPQVIGIFAATVMIFAFGVKSDDRFKMIATLANVLFCAHFFMLGAYAASIVSVIDIVRNLFSVRFHKSNKAMCALIGIYLLFASFIVHNFVDLLPFLAGIIITFALYKLSGISMRFCLLITSCMWLTYHFFFMSIGGILTEFFVLSMNVTTIYRLYKDKKHAV